MPLVHLLHSYKRWRPRLFLRALRKEPSPVCATTNKMDLVPRQNSTGGKIRLGGITKRGNRYLRLAG